eukprot:TRINITY_DN62148_c0_g1_i1.p1 TRINITY_DN62148_c0_g1~~TRINITY_DN62148_c0_g1_i1.p1  ORF type:complete len:323 (+),score=53.99 TRINITY_DN62148_c0_g1_i1:58-969(+)
MASADPKCPHPDCGGHVSLCIPLGEIEELYKIDVTTVHPDRQGLTVLSLREHLSSKFRVLYCDRLRFEAVPVFGPVVPLCIGDTVPQSPAQVRVKGPASVLQMIVVGLRSTGSPLSRSPLQKPTEIPKKSKKNAVGLSAVSIEALASNLAKRKSSQSAPLKAVFLDVDGVLNFGSAMMGLEIACVKRLAHLVQETEACIVLSSSWRWCEASKLELVNALVSAGLSEECLVGQTPDISDGDMCAQRASEICAWLEAEPCIGNWVVLDDMDLTCAAKLEGHFVHTAMQHGLSDNDALEAFRILNT